MVGYGLLRDLALEAGRRLDIGNGVFYLNREELFEALRTGRAPRQLIEQRELAHRTETRLSLPRVIEAESIEQLGEAAEANPATGGYKAMPISAGQASGPVRILHSATDAGDLGIGYILVCPSTDPAWTPLFVNAAGLVLERGGALSHGAVVAREMGLPAVVLPDATRLFHDGEKIDLNANQGRVVRALHADGTSLVTDAVDPEDTRIPRELAPPPPGRKERKAAKIRNATAALWTFYLLGFFLLPKAYVHEPSLALMDVVLWPLVNSLGRPAVVALIAAIVAAGTLLVQKLVTDNRALLEAKRRAALLVKAARVLPENSPRRKAMTDLAATVNGRLLLAGMVPLGLLLGPLMLPFVWFNDRLDPTVPTAAAGSPVQIVATVDGEWTKPVRIEVPAPFALDETTPAVRMLPPLRATLEHLLALYRQPQNNPTGPWELQVAPDLGRTQTALDLKNYLDAGLPPQGITWTLRPTEKTAGRFTVRVAGDGHPAVAVDVVLGHRFPPAASSAAGEPNSPLTELRVIYPNASQKPVFWQPFARLAAPDNPTFVHTLAAWDSGWLWLYVLTYLPLLFILRLLLKVA